MPTTAPASSMPTVTPTAKSTSSTSAPTTAPTKIEVPASEKPYANTPTSASLSKTPSDYDQTTTGATEVPATTPIPSQSTTVAPANKSPSTASSQRPTSAQGCTNVSVVGDATYCIAGPVCSGAGLIPAGSKCPVKNDAAIAACIKTLKSYVDGVNCRAPVDAVCQKIPSGVWGCVFPTVSTIPNAYPAPTPASSIPTSYPVPTPASTFLRA
ncbi:hypothetical protein SDRG_09040 [Saprolegnia diclina VS20]|uniref:Uncharacterized protein n=1 Tax=Saprolegnia diclina (strain VS20) TaxID=1156394 RepID=T0RMJ6_SAPDV|nr:hypothetical protein SDRG_09040 [Saprolegnia diclina VS20]EQC33533.1 hypothetical protein SDRG_09040 [Saprolegnia diclina VS20]|eukprot:XP_008613173.1 hypothetical protein SDRG_09040 [Saprolegnia diclina VS20]